MNADLALVLLVKEIMGQLDEVASLRREGRRAALSIHLLREMCAVLHDLEPQYQERYLEILISTASKAEAPSLRVPSDEQVSASLSPKKRTLDRILTQLKAA